MTLEQFYSDVLSIADASLVSDLATASTKRHLMKGEFLIRTGEEQSQVFFAENGILRSALQDAEGNDITDCIISRPGMPAMPSAMLHGPSAASIEALTDCDVVCIKTDAIEQMIATDLSLSHLQNRMLQEAWQGHRNVKIAICQKNAHDRYLWFLQEYPGLIDLIPHRHIASFLGMTPVTLSRVRTSLKTDQDK